MNIPDYKKVFSKATKWALNGNNKVKLLFLLISVILWFLIKLSKPNYVGELKFPVNYEQMPQGKVLMSEPPKFINLKLEANGFTLFKHSISSYKKLQIALNKLQMLPNGKHYWLPENDLRSIESQLSEDARVLNVYPDTVFFNFSQLESKSVPVKLNLNEESLGSLMVYGEPKLNPANVLVQGPTALLQKIKELETEVFKIPNTKEDSLKIELKLQPDNAKNLSFSHNSIEAVIQLSKLTENSVNERIELINIPDSLSLELYPNNVQVTYRMALRDFHKVEEHSFRIIADYKELEEYPDSRFLNLKIEEYSSAIRHVEITPKRVEYISVER